MQVRARLREYLPGKFGEARDFFSLAEALRHTVARLASNTRISNVSYGSERRTGRRYMLMCMVYCVLV
jgi:hypothetical protein